MTDNEIIKALECCINNGDCRECALNPKKGNYGYCTGLAIKSALDLINRQKAENSNLTSDLTSLRNDLTSAKAEIERLNKQLIFEINSAFDRGKTEAYKEFAKRFCAITKAIPEMKAYFIRENDLDNLLKEMVGENDA